MSVAYYIVLDHEDPGFDTFVNGKSLAREDSLDSLCQNIGLGSFDDFLTMSEEDISDMLGEDIELPEGDGEQWFTAEEGLAYFGALADHINANPTSVDDAKGCLEDLADYVCVLNKAKAVGAKWHLNLDI